MDEFPFHGTKSLMVLRRLRNFWERVRVCLRELDPLEALFLLVFTISGAVQLQSGARPGSIDVLLPENFRTMWLCTFLMGSLLALVGNFWLGKQRTDGLIFEHVGLWWVGLSLLVYGAAQIIASILYDPYGSAVLLAGPTTVMLGIAFCWKATKIQTVLNKFKRLS